MVCLWAMSSGQVQDRSQIVLGTRKYRQYVSNTFIVWRNCRNSIHVFSRFRFSQDSASVTPSHWWTGAGKSKIEVSCPSKSCYNSKNLYRRPSCQLGCRGYKTPTCLLGPRCCQLVPAWLLSPYGGWHWRDLFTHGGLIPSQCCLHFQCCALLWLDAEWCQQQQEVATALHWNLISLFPKWTISMSWSWREARNGDLDMELGRDALWFRSQGGISSKLMVSAADDISGRGIADVKYTAGEE